MTSTPYWTVGVLQAIPQLWWTDKVQFKVQHQRLFQPSSVFSRIVLWSIGAHCIFIIFQLCTLVTNLTGSYCVDSTQEDSIGFLIHALMTAIGWCCKCLIVIGPAWLWCDRLEPWARRVPTDSPPPCYRWEQRGHRLLPHSQVSSQQWCRWDDYISHFKSVIWCSCTSPLKWVGFPVAPQQRVINGPIHTFASPMCPSSGCDVNSPRQPGPSGEGDEEARDGQSPLHLAGSWGLEEVVQCLLEFGANVNAQVRSRVLLICFNILHQVH